MNKPLLQRINLKKSAAVFMVLSTLFTSVGFVVTYHIQKYNWHKQQHEKKEGEQTVTLHLTKEEFRNALVEKHELVINGEWYDIRSVKHIGDSVEVVAIHDKHEKSLISLLTGNHDSNNLPLQQWLKVSFAAAIITNPLSLCYNCYQSECNYSDIILYSHIYSATLVKPPSHLIS